MPYTTWDTVHIDILSSTLFLPQCCIPWQVWLPTFGDWWKQIYVTKFKSCSKAEHCQNINCPWHKGHRTCKQPWSSQLMSHMDCTSNWVQLTFAARKFERKFSHALRNRVKAKKQIQRLGRIDQGFIWHWTKPNSLVLAELPRLVSPAWIVFWQRRLMSSHCMWCSNYYAGVPTATIWPQSSFILLLQAKSMPTRELSSSHQPTKRGTNKFWYSSTTNAENL